jgi:glycosyltransferase involved in cell wall biosynthesis
MSVPISVVVPTYNRASLIGATLESILDQSCAPAEVIVVDDGSTDETESIVRRFPSMVKYYRIENSGACAARNFGVSRAASPWIAFCDSDDLWTREKLAKQIALHQQGGVEYSFTNFRIVTGGIWKEQTKFDTAPPGFFSDFQPTPEGLIAHRPYYDDLLRFQPIFPSTVLMSKRFFEKVGGFKLELGRNSAEDVEFNLRCTQHWPIGAIAEPVVGIRKHESNISGDNYRTNCDGLELLHYVLQTHTLSQRSRELIARRIIECGISAGERAFALADFKGCTKLLSGVPRAQMGSKTRLKFLIASCPRPIARTLHALVSRFNTARRRAEAN